VDNKVTGLKDTQCCATI